MWRFNRASNPAVARAQKLLGEGLAIEKEDASFTPEPPKRDAEFGSVALVKTLYEGKGSTNGRYNWVDSPPKTLGKKVAKAHNQVAIKVYKIIDDSQPTFSGRSALKIHGLDIQSPHLVATLKDIVQVEGVFLEASETAKFQEPFGPLFFTFDKIASLARSTPDGTLGQHLSLLVGVLNEIFAGFMHSLKNLRASGLISYQLAWTYFPRGSQIYSPPRAGGGARVCRVVETKYRSNDQKGDYLAVVAEEVAFDGTSFAWRPVQLEIPAFGGNLPVEALPHFPLMFHENPDAVCRSLKERARRVLEYQELSYREYDGIAVFAEGCNVARHNVSGRILIDFYGYSKHHRCTPQAKVLQRTIEMVSRPGEGEGQTRKLTIGQKPAPEFGLTEEQQEANKEEILSRGDDLVFVTPVLEGFALKNKLWLNFDVDNIKPVNWNDDAFEHLVYQEEQKDLVLTFVENHKRLKRGADDVIMGKGQGLILLLSGPPGTGKTLLSEAVADKTRRPLYYLQAEDLGTNPSTLGPKIKNVFETATEWDAVILLDEADVFMAERNPADITRNELVSIFLRELEYFQGIIFLTTNLYNTIDVAFRSRVHIHLLFPPLAPSSRFLLWEKFLARLPPTYSSLAGADGDAAGASALGDDVLSELAKWDLNGREIKNSVKTVRTWCLCKGFEMSLSRLESGIKVTAPQAVKVDEVE